MSLAEKIGVKIPEILLPKKEVDLNKWAVIACDQFTSQPEYWQRVAEYVGDAPSTYHMILPEVWLHSADITDRIKATQNSMRKYLENGVFDAKQGFIFVERSYHEKKRLGLVVALDLETYDYHKGSQTLIRATEGTILNRLPPRMEVRRGAPLECPHIMVLYDDPNQTVLVEVKQYKNELPLCYDFELMEGSGHLTGYLVQESSLINSIISALADLIDPDTYQEKYNLTSTRYPILFAMGDGNHSLATAKAIWEELKPSVSPDHPARYALVELVNLHDTSLNFEPIHRVLFNPAEDLQSELKYYFASGVSIIEIEKMSGLIEKVNQKVNARQRFGIINPTGYWLVEIDKPVQNLAVGNLQEFLDHYLSQHPETTIDYVHGDEVVEQLGLQPGNTSFYLPPIEKESFFKTVIVDGALPRKTFSMGHAQEKRFYMECRRITDTD